MGGSLTQRTPCGMHFETFQVNMVPTYVSKVLSAQGSSWRLAKCCSGIRFWGVLLSSALMCAAICWMLQGWMPPSWALLGGILAVIRLGTFCYWANSYWGGAVAALGGALVLGALPRIKEKQRVRDAAWMASLWCSCLIAAPTRACSWPFRLAVVLLVLAA